MLDFPIIEVRTIQIFWIICNLFSKYVPKLTDTYNYYAFRLVLLTLNLTVLVSVIILVTSVQHILFCNKKWFIVAVIILTFSLFWWCMVGCNCKQVRLIQHLFFLPGPPNLTMSWQFLHSPQSLRQHPEHDPHLRFRIGATS